MYVTGPDDAETTTATPPAVAAIVPHDETPVQDKALLQRLLPLALRAALLGVLLFASWWVWPRQSVPLRANQAEPPLAQQPANQPTLAAPPATLIVLLPTPTPQPEQSAGLIEITSQPLTLTNAAGDATSPFEASAGVDQPPVAQPETIVLAAPVPTKVAVVLAPTATPIVEPAAEPTPSGPVLPQVRIIPAVGIKLPPTRTPGGEEEFVGPTPTPTPEPLPIDPGRLWSSFVPLPAAENDHFWVGRPFLPNAPNQVASPSYQFGSTAGDRYRPHHGVDMSNPMGTPVLAGVEGEVVHAGLDDPELLGPYNNFYGNTVVIRLERKLTVGDGQLDVYVLYGHLSQVLATVGQRVGPQDVVGAVGMTGIAIGPHLHVEMRLGANTYRHSVNPYLWMQPLGDNGAVAVRLLTADGRTWPGAKLTLARFEGGRATWARLIETYLDTENIGPDPAWGENGAMDGVPPGYYVIVGTVNGESIRTELTVNPGQTTFVEIRTQQ